MTKPLTPAQLRYRAYLQSDHWQTLRQRILARADEHCERCHRFCGKNPHWPSEDYCGDSECRWCFNYLDSERVYRNEMHLETLEIHHLTYERIGCERESDLQALCWGCHESVTERSQEMRQILASLVGRGLLPKERSKTAADAWKFFSELAAGEDQPF